MPVFICAECDEAIVLLGDARQVECDCGATMCRLEDAAEPVTIAIPVGGAA